MLSSILFITFLAAPVGVSAFMGHGSKRKSSKRDKGSSSKKKHAKSSAIAASSSKELLSPIVYLGDEPSRKEQKKWEQPNPIAVLAEKAMEAAVKIGGADGYCRENPASTYVHTRERCASASQCAELEGLKDCLTQGDLGFDHVILFEKGNGCRKSLNKLPRMPSKKLQKLENKVNYAYGGHGGHGQTKAGTKGGKATARSSARSGGKASAKISENTRLPLSFIRDFMVEEDTKLEIMPAACVPLRVHCAQQRSTLECHDVDGCEWVEEVVSPNWELRGHFTRNGMVLLPDIPCGPSERERVQARKPCNLKAPTGSAENSTHHKLAKNLDKSFLGRMISSKEWRQDALTGTHDGAVYNVPYDDCERCKEEDAPCGSSNECCSAKCTNHSRMPCSIFAPCRCEVQSGAEEEASSSKGQVSQPTELIEATEEEKRENQALKLMPILRPPKVTREEKVSAMWPVQKKQRT